MVKRMAQRLELLAAGNRNAPARHQTMRNTLAWSYDLLDDTERALFAKLGVFAGSFSIESTETVCDASLDAISSLVDKSLVRRERDRLDMLETIRSFAVEKLEQNAFVTDIRDRHAQH